MLKQNEKVTNFGEITATLSHDIRKPFALIKAFMDQISERRLDDDFMRNSEREIELSVMRSEKIMEDILLYTSDMKLELSKCNPQSLINTSLRETFKQYSNTDISFEYDFKHTQYLNIDSMAVLQVFNCIIENAVEAMNQNGKIWFGTRDLDNNKQQMVEISISNSGLYIEKNDLEKIFNPFFTKDKRKKSGLGLSIARKIVSLHGGEIKVRSDKAKGTTFAVMLPSLPGNLSLNEKEIIKHSSEIQYEPQKEVCDRTNMRMLEIKEMVSFLTEPIKILVVDDEPLFRSSLRKTINGIMELKDKIDVIEVSTGEEALQILKKTKIKEQYPCAIVDIDMGENNMDGFEFAKTFINKHADAKVIIHSNWNLPDTLIRTKQSGAIGFLPKPMTKIQFIEFLLKVIKVKTSKLAKLEAKKSIFDDIIITTKPKVLIVDDQSYMAHYVESILNKEYSSILAFDGEEGLTKAKEILPDLVILDLVMPKKDGYEVCKELKDTECTKHIPVIVLTSKKGLDDKLKSLKLGASEFLTKPFDKQELLVRVSSLIKQNRMHNFIMKQNTDLVNTLVKLQSTHDRLVQCEKMASLGMLASGMAHEIRNRMNFIANAIEPLKNRFEEILDKKKISSDEVKKDTLDLFKIVNQGVERIGNVIDGISTFTRGVNRKFDWFNINEAIESALAVSKSIYKKEIKVETDLKAKREIKCNVGQMNQVMLNLFMNAIQAIRAKKEKQGKIIIKTWDDENNIKFSFKDNGVGISKEQKLKIFDPFYTTKETKAGENMGLGLSICYNIIDVHKGKIEVESEEKEGTEFIVSLPVE